LVHPFEEIFEVVESALPKPGHLACPIDQRRQGAELRAIVGLATFVAVEHQAGLLPLATQSFEDSPPGRIGERSEEHIVRVRHFKSITGWLLIDI
jgi:hypothetical protein